MWDIENHVSIRNPVWPIMLTVISSWVITTVLRVGTAAAQHIIDVREQLCAITLVSRIIKMTYSFAQLRPQRESPERGKISLKVK